MSGSVDLAPLTTAMRAMLADRRNGERRGVWVMAVTFTAVGLMMAYLLYLALAGTLAVVGTTGAVVVTLLLAGRCVVVARRPAATPDSIVGNYLRYTRGWGGAYATGTYADGNSGKYFCLSTPDGQLRFFAQPPSALQDRLEQGYTGTVLATADTRRILAIWDDAGHLRYSAPGYDASVDQELPPPARANARQP